MDGLSGCLELLKSDDELALVLDVVSSPWTDRVVVGRKSRDGCAMKGLSGVRRRGERAEHHLCLLLKSGRASVDRTVNSIERRPLGDVAFWPAATAHGEARTPDTLTASPSLHLLAEFAICQPVKTVEGSRVDAVYQLPDRLMNPESAWSPNNAPGPSWGQVWGRVPRQCHWSVAARARLSRLSVQKRQEPSRGLHLCFLSCKAYLLLTKATNSHVSRQRTLLSALLVCKPLRGLIHTLKTPC